MWWQSSRPPCFCSRWIESSRRKRLGSPPRVPGAQAPPAPHASQSERVKLKLNLHHSRAHCCNMLFKLILLIFSLHAPGPEDEVAVRALPFLRVVVVAGHRCGAVAYRLQWQLLRRTVSNAPLWITSDMFIIRKVLLYVLSS